MARTALRSGYPADRGHAHQASYAIYPYSYTGLIKYRMDVRCAVGTVRALMDRSDPIQQHDLLAGPRGGGPLQPSVVAAGGDIQEAAQSVDRTGGLVRLYEREDSGSVSVSRGSQALALARISRSILSFLFSRRRRRSSARSSVVRPSSRLPLPKSS